MAAKSWYKAKHPSTIPAEFYAPLGRILAGWTFTELYLQSIIWKVTRVRDFKQARLLTWGRNARDLTELFSSLERWIPSSEKDEHKAISKEAERLRSERNRFAHGLWGYKPGQKPRVWTVFYLRENKRKLDPRPHKYSPGDVLKLANELDALNARIKAMHKRLRARTP